MKKLQSLVKTFAVALGFGSLVQCASEETAELSMTVATQKSSYRRGEHVHLTSPADAQNKTQTSTQGISTSEPLPAMPTHFQPLKDSSSVAMHSASILASQRRFNVPHDYQVVTFSRQPTLPELKALQSKGGGIESKVAPNIYLLQAPSNASVWTLGLPISSARDLTIEDKVDQRILRGTYDPRFAIRDSPTAAARLPVYVQFHSDVPESEVQKVINSFALPISVVYQEGPIGMMKVTRGVTSSLKSPSNSIKINYLSPLNLVTTLLEPDRVKMIASDARVRKVMIATPHLENLNNDSRRMTHMTEVNASFDVNGARITGMVYDAGLAAQHPDLYGRIISPMFGFSIAHATHVTCTVAGNGAASKGKYAGMIPKATIVTAEHGDCDPKCIYDDPNMMALLYSIGIMNYDVKFITNSIGENVARNGYDCDDLGDYETTAALVDGFVYGLFGMPPVPILYAAGNERNLADGRPCGEYNTVTTPGVAKNAITVGAVTKDVDQKGKPQKVLPTEFTSFGPVSPNMHHYETSLNEKQPREPYKSQRSLHISSRLKPDVVAPGEDIMSCVMENWKDPKSKYLAKDGTSMAAPGVAGNVGALCDDALSRGEPCPLPSTTKAVLLHTACDLEETGPDYKTGYGLVNGKAAIQLLREGRAFEDVLVSTGDTKGYTVNVPEGLPELKITLAWSDPPAEPHAMDNSIIVHDLDGRLTDPQGNAYLPFTLDGTNPTAPATTGDNKDDPVEQIVVKKPTPGKWYFSVSSKSALLAPQVYSIAYNSGAPFNRNVSRLCNMTDEPVNGYLTLAVRRKSSPAYDPQKPAVGLEKMVLNDLTAGLKRTIPAQSCVLLAPIWEAAGGYVAREEDEYDVLARFEDSNASVICNGGCLEDKFSFIVHNGL
ncbi:S8 family serine peptidase [Candidatus Woesearchaeota archaeon]|nr:S8 family serine peptidase [Candidatus Woesearchaeota archaeon]